MKYAWKIQFPTVVAWVADSSILRQVCERYGMLPREDR